MHKSADVRASPFAGRTYSTGSVTGIPSAVLPFRRAIRTCNSATWRSKSLAIRDWPSSLMQFILLSTRLRRRYPLHRRQMARPRIFRGAQRFVAGDGARSRRPPRLGILVGRNDCSGTARGDSLVAFPGVVGAVCGHRGDLFVYRDLVKKVGQDWTWVTTRYDLYRKVFLSAIALAALVIYWL